MVHPSIIRLSVPGFDKFWGKDGMGVIIRLQCQFASGQCSLDLLKHLIFGRFGR
jgi:hypothetical protein